MQEIVVIIGPGSVTRTAAFGYFIRGKRSENEVTEGGDIPNPQVPIHGIHCFLSIILAAEEFILRDLSLRRKFQVVLAGGEQAQYDQGYKNVFFHGSVSYKLVHDLKIQGESK
jgi:hypothetical protein